MWQRAWGRGGRDPPLSLRNDVSSAVQLGLEAVNYLCPPTCRREEESSEPGGVVKRPNDPLGWQEPGKPGLSHSASWF